MFLNNLKNIDIIFLRVTPEIVDVLLQFVLTDGSATKRWQTWTNRLQARTAQSIGESSKRLIVEPLKAGTQSRTSSTRTLVWQMAECGANTAPRAARLL